MAVTDSDPCHGDRLASIERFLTVLSEVFGVPDLTLTDHFLDIGGDSLDAVIVMDRIDLEFGVRPELDMFFQSESVADLAHRWWQMVVEARATAPVVGGDTAAR
jgi:acyl carrier protein